MTNAETMRSTRTVYVLPLRRYTDWTDAERDAAHSWLASHGIQPNAVPLSTTIRIELDLDAKLSISTYTKILDSYGRDHRCPTCESCIQVHRIGRPLHTPPPYMPEWGSVLETFTTYDGTTVTKAGHVTPAAKEDETE